MEHPQASNQASPEALAKSNIAQTVKLVETAQANKVGAKLLQADELECMGASNSDLITLTIDNTTAGVPKDIQLSFGTPLGNPAEYTAVPLYATLVDFWLDNLADLVDQQGASVPFFQLLNKRFQRHAILVSQIEVVTDDTAIGQNQRKEQITRVLTPYNSSSDSNQVSGGFIPQFTEYTASNLFTKGIVLGEFHGFLYKILANSIISLNIYVHSIDTPNFRLDA